MLIPINHENMRGRRWPWVTIAIIGLNLLVFLGTNWTIEEEAHKLGEIKAHILMLAVPNRDLKLTPAEASLVENFEKSNPALYAELRSSNRPVEDSFDAQTRMLDSDAAQAELITLGQQYDRLEASSILERFAFTPASPRPISWITSMFLHGGWLHLIFNMWFLWLAGTILEDTWGRILYPIFYLVAGVAASLAHATADPHSVIPTLGASGAIAGLMGAFLARFPKTKIQMAWVLWLIVRFRVYKFKAPAYTLLPLWLGVEFLSGAVGGGDGVAHWAHIGGFLFGAAAAMVLRYSGLEQKADKAIEAKVSWTADPHLLKAEQALTANDPQTAIAEIKALLVTQSESLEAYNLLAAACARAQDSAGSREALAALVRLHVNRGELEQAWERFEEFRAAGGEKIHKAVWLELARHLERKQKWDRATVEYEALARAYPNDRAAVVALLAAARIQGEQLDRRDDAARLYRAAEASPAQKTGLDLEIRTGLEKFGRRPAVQPALP